MKPSIFGWSSTTTFIAVPLLGDHLRRAIQVKIRTSAAITHTALVGSSDATNSPAENAIGIEQLLHRLMILTSLYLTQISKKCYS